MLLNHKPKKAPRGLPKDLGQLVGLRARVKPGTRVPQLETKRFTDQDRATVLNPERWGIIVEADNEGAGITWDGPSCITIHLPWGKLEINARGLALVT
jgi:hypothetical protein